MEEKNNLFEILNDESVEQYPELSVVGWIDNGDKYIKVSGIIDLLYRYNDEWYILDYKTDGNKDSLEKYKIQIQTYQWMVKQLYNIEANGQIYFSAFNELVSVDWNDDYFTKIFQNASNPFHFTKHLSLMDLSSIKKIILQEKNENILIINYTKYQSDNMRRTLSNEKLLSPNIKIKNINEIIRSQVVNGKKMSPSLLQLAVSTIVSENEKRGTIKILSKAISENEQYNDEIVKFDDKNIVEKFNNLKEEKQLITNSDILKNFIKNNDYSDKIVIMNGFFEITDEKVKLYKGISKQSKKFYFIDNFDDNKVKNEFEYDVSVWDKKVKLPNKKTDQVCKLCYSIYEEVEQLANDILSIPDWKNKIDEMKITTSSMQRYLPILKNTFSEYGIPLRIVIGASLIEYPIAQFILKIVKLMQSYENWQDIRDLIFDPFFIVDNEKYYNFDKWVRENGFEKYIQIKENIIPEQKDIFDEITKVIEEKLRVKNNVFDIEKKLNEFIDNYKIFEKNEDNDQNSKVLEKVLKIAKTITENYSIMGLTGNIKDFTIDLKERLMEETMAVKEQKYGFELLGFFDTINLKAEKLFVLGMVEGDYPIKKGNNIFVKHENNYGFQREVYLLKHWMKLGNKVQYYSSEKNSKGDALQPSTFMEYVKIQKVYVNFTNSRKNHYIKYYNKKISTDEKKNVIERHNDYLGIGDKKYIGKTADCKDDKLVFSVGSMDDLLKCPMKYWFGHKLHLNAIDGEKMDKANLGIIIHKVLENFGRINGFELAKTNKVKAISRLKEIFEDIIEENEIKFKDDLILQKTFKNFNNNFEENGNNLFVKLIDWNLETFNNYDYINFEKQFEETVNYEGKELNVKLRIDKILESNNEDMIIATDYKTGNVNEKDTINKLSSQMILYYLILKKMYPKKKIALVFEKMKSFAKNKHGVSKFFGDVEHNSKFGKKVIKFVNNVNEKTEDDDVVLYEIMEFYFKQIEKIKNGEFYITDRIENNICNYCAYDKICRKNSLNQ